MRCRISELQRALRGIARLCCGPMPLAITITLATTEAAIAQSTERPDKVAFVVSALTTHVLALGAQIKLTEPIYVAARVEGLNRRRAFGVGPHVTIVSDNAFRLNGTGLIGKTSCRRQGEFVCANSEEGSAWAVAGALGAEFRIARRWSNALEITYWRPLEEASSVETDFDQPRLTLGIAVKYFPW